MRTARFTALAVILLAAQSLEARWTTLHEHVRGNLLELQSAEVRAALNRRLHATARNLRHRSHDYNFSSSDLADRRYVRDALASTEAQIRSLVDTQTVQGTE